VVRSGTATYRVNTFSSFVVQFGGVITRVLLGGQTLGKLFFQFSEPAITCTTRILKKRSRVLQSRLRWRAINY
jgi:hypothetical protein